METEILSSHQGTVYGDPSHSTPVELATGAPTYSVYHPRARRETNVSIDIDSKIKLYIFFNNVEEELGSRAVGTPGRKQLLDIGEVVQ